MDGQARLSHAHAPVVVLGFGVAAVSAIVALRSEGYRGRVEVVTDGEAQPYSPVLTSYYAGGRIGREQCFAWSDLRPQEMVDVVYEHERVEALDVAAHEVRLASGRAVRYSKLVVATGAHPIAPGFPQVDGCQPLVLRTLDDAECLRRALVSPHCTRVLVSGTSMVGLKALEACLDRGVAPTLLGRSARILTASAHPIVAERFERLLADRGVDVCLGRTVTYARTVAHARTVEDAPGYEIAFDDGRTERYDEVVLAQGTAPNLDFVDPLELEMDRGLLVDASMRTSAPDVFAAGDVAQALDLCSGRRRIIGLWQNAVQQGRCAGRTIAAELAGHSLALPYPGSIPNNVIHVRDILFASAGSLEGEETRVDVRESSDGLCVFAYARSGMYEGRMIGFNLLSVAAGGGGADALESTIGAYKREVLRSYLQ